MSKEISDFNSMIAEGLKKEFPEMRISHKGAILAAELKDRFDLSMAVSGARIDFQIAAESAPSDLFYGMPQRASDIPLLPVYESCRRFLRIPDNWESPMGTGWQDRGTAKEN